MRGPRSGTRLTPKPRPSSSATRPYANTTGRWRRSMPRKRNAIARVAAQEQAQAERARAVDASRRASTEAAIAQAVSDFLQSDLLAQSSAQQQATPDSKPDPDLKVRTALDRAAARRPGAVSQPAAGRGVGARNDRCGVPGSRPLHGGARDSSSAFVSCARRISGSSAEPTLEATRNLAQISMQMGKYPEAETLYKEAIDGLARRRGATDERVLDVQAQLVEVNLQKGRYQAAEALIVKHDWHGAPSSRARRIHWSLAACRSSGARKSRWVTIRMPKRRFRTLLEGLAAKQGGRSSRNALDRIGPRRSARDSTEVFGGGARLQRGARGPAPRSRRRSPQHA